MKSKLKVLKDILIVIMIGGVVVVSPYAYFQLQERQLLHTETEIPIKTIKIEKNSQGELSMEQRREMIYREDEDIEKISLKTGDVYSLYEARRQCYRELCKISVLEMDIYGPPQKDIEIFPQLIVDSKTPAYSMIIWKGTFKIKNILYEIVLEEESGKLLSVHMVDEDTAGYIRLKEDLEKELEVYFYD